MREARILQVTRWGHSSRYNATGPLIDLGMLGAQQEDLSAPGGISLRGRGNAAGAATCRSGCAGGV